jgi:hypothetical protein
MIDKVDGLRIGADKNEFLIEMWKGLQENRERPYKIEKELYSKARDSYNKKDYSLFDKFIIGWIGWTGSFNGRFFDGGYSGHSVGKRDYITEQIKNIEPVSKMLDENKTLEEIAKIVTGDENLKVLERTEPKFECNCSREKCEKGLIAIGKKELEDIIKEEEKIQIECNFCNSKYVFTREELQEIVAKM